MMVVLGYPCQFIGLFEDGKVGFVLKNSCIVIGERKGEGV